ncbi:MAG: 4Fe-4S binding protein [Vicinamibacterales bacterium]
MIQPDDPWGFDEEPVETWSDLLAAQGPDLALLAAFLLLAFVSFHRKSVRLKYVTLAASVAYMGFYKSNLLSITDVFRIVDWSFPPFDHNLAWYLFAGVTVVSTVLWGRFYCGRVCAFGAFTQLMDAVLPSSWRVEVPKPLEQRAGWIKFGILGAVLLYYVTTHNTMVYRYVEPFWMFGRSETSVVLWAALGLLVVASVFVRNLYCRFLCPLGATLGAHLARHGVPDQAVVGMFDVPDLRYSQSGAPSTGRGSCARSASTATTASGCADTARCPHWRILDYKARKAGGAVPLTPSVRSPATGARHVTERPGRWPIRASAGARASRGRPVPATPARGCRRSRSRPRPRAAARPAPGPAPGGVEDARRQPVGVRAWRATMVTLRQPRAGCPVAGSRMW